MKVEMPKASWDEVEATLDSCDTDHCFCDMCCENGHCSCNKCEEPCDC